MLHMTDSCHSLRCLEISFGLTEDVFDSHRCERTLQIHLFLRCDFYFREEEKPWIHERLARDTTSVGIVNWLKLVKIINHFLVIEIQPKLNKNINIRLNVIMRLASQNYPIQSHNYKIVS